MDYIVYLFAVLLLLGPALITAIYSKIEYHKTLKDNLENWKTGKLAGFILFCLISYYVLLPSNIDWYLGRFWIYYLEPGISIALVIYSKPASELLEGMSSWFSFGEDIAFLIGWFGLLLTSFWIYIDVLGR